MFAGLVIKIYSMVSTLLLCTVLSFCLFDKIECFDVTIIIGVCNCFYYNN